MWCNPREVRADDLDILRPTNADDVRDALLMIAAFDFGRVPQLGRDMDDHDAGAAQSRAGRHRRLPTRSPAPVERRAR